MRVSKSTCGLCKPTKKWKKNNTKLKSIFINTDELTANFIKSHFKKFKTS